MPLDHLLPKNIKASLPVMVLLLVSGCSFVPGYERPDVSVPASFTAAGTDAPGDLARDWWKMFGSAELNTLMDQALTENTDIRAGLARIDQARALLRSERASLLPTADIAASAERARKTEPDSTDTTLRAAPTISYELDLFGKNRAAYESADADLDAARYAQESLKLLVMAEVSNTYFNLLAARERLKIADKNLENSVEVLRIVQARFDIGETDALDLSRQKAQDANTRAVRASIEREVKNAENALNVLLGKAPGTVAVTAMNLAPVAVPNVAPGQPSALLERRPDIRQSEAALMAANADIGAARAAFFPSVTLGLDAGITKILDNPASTVLSGSSEILAPIFRGGSLLAALDLSKARKAELAENYRKTVLTAFQDVEDSLAAVKAAQIREQSFETAMKESRKSYELSRSRYDAGTIDFQTLLDSQRTLLQAESDYAASKNERLAAAVSLFKALGGGWREEE